MNDTRTINRGYEHRLKPHAAFWTDRKWDLALCLLVLFGLLGCAGPSTGDEGLVGQGFEGLPLFRSFSGGRIANDGGASRGVGWADFDQDGDPDLVVSNTAGQWNHFYLNGLLGRRDDWRPWSSGQVAPDSASARSEFLKASDPSVSPLGGVASAAGRAEGVAWVDYDGDGDLDLHIVTRGPEQDFLFENRGTEGLVRATGSSLERVAGSSMACWADADLDGWLDVFLVAYGAQQPNTFFRNIGQGRFEELEGAPVTSGNGTGRACAWGDPDDDGLPDLYVGNAREANQLFRNRGGFRFEPDLDAGHVVEAVGYTYGVSWADFDEDGHQDLFVANFDVKNVLYRNDGTGQLIPVEENVISRTEGGASKGHAWGDYDLDGDLDLFVANGTYGPDMRNFLYLNEGRGAFLRDSRGEVTAHADTSAGTAWADVDLDGDLDLFVANWGSSDQVNRFYENMVADRTDRGWVALELRSGSPNTHGWGAKVRAMIRIGGTEHWMTRWHIPTTGYGSQNELLVHFGVGGAAQVDSLTIRWPSGRTDAFGRVPVRRRLKATEGGSLEVLGESF